MIWFNNSDELYHHGIKGQKWGVRNGPPYPIEDTVLRKGTRLNSVSSKFASSKSYMNNGKWMYTYRKDDEWDNKVYKGPFSANLVAYKGAQYVREHEFEIIKDLRMPTKKQRIDEFKQLFNDKNFSQKVKTDMEAVRKAMVQQMIGTPEDHQVYKNFDVNNVKSEDDYKIAYDIFNHAMESLYARESTVEYAKRMAKKYDAMVDDNDQGVFNNAHDPIIIFRTNEVLKDVSNPKSPKYLSVNEIMNNYDYVEKKLNKIGKEVFL